MGTIKTIYDTISDLLLVKVYKEHKVQSEIAIKEFKVKIVELEKKLAESEKKLAICVAENAGLRAENEQLRTEIATLKRTMSGQLPPYVDGGPDPI